MEGGDGFRRYRGLVTRERVPDQFKAAVVIGAMIDEVLLVSGS